MILPGQKDAIHRGQIYRLLIEIADDTVLSKNLVFKGGTCAALLGRLNRFSVDLDFDILPKAKTDSVHTVFKKIFSALNLGIKDQSTEVVQYVLKYDTPQGTRNTLKLDAVSSPLSSDEFASTHVPDIDRYLICQTIETQFAHKLVAVTNRYEKHGSIAGRDIYDIHHFFLKQYRYKEEIILERTELRAKEYIRTLIDFIEKNVTETIINEDINMLLPYEQFKVIRKSLKSEVIAMLKGEL